MGDAEHEKRVRAIQDAMSFAGPFAAALIKLRKAEVEGTEAILTTAEAKAVIEALRMLRSQRKGGG